MFMFRRLVRSRDFFLPRISVPKHICVNHVLSQCLAVRERCLHTSHHHWLQSVYSNEEQTKLLQVLNRVDSTTAARLKLPRKRIAKVLEYRQKHGTFQNLDEVLEVRNLGTEIIFSLFDGILKKYNEFEVLMINYTKEECSDKNMSLMNDSVIENCHNNYSNDKYSDIENKSNNLENPQIAPGAVTPPLVASRIMVCKSVASIILKQNHLAWTVLESEESWQRQQISNWGVYEFAPIKALEDNLVCKILEMKAVLPKADMYVLEAEPMYATKSKKTRSTPRVTTSHLTAVGVTLICALHNFNTEVEDQVYLIKHGVSSHFFGLRVGQEAVSPQHVITDFLTSGNSGNDNKVLSRSLSELLVGDKSKQFYLSSVNVDKENLCQSLLVGKIFVEMIKSCGP